MGLAEKTWIRSLYPITGFITLVYLFCLSLTWAGAFDLPPKNPVTILGYVSFAHLVGVPLLWFALNGRPQYYLIFVLVNAVWIVAAIVMVVLIYTKVLGEITYNYWRGDEFHQVALYGHLLNAVALEILTIVHMNHIHTVLTPEEAGSV